MKKVILICLLVIVGGSVFGQTVVQRANSANTVSDGRWEGRLNSFQPRYADTTAANLQIGIDSAGAIIYTYDIKGFWYRQHSPKKWVRIVSDNNLSDNFFFDSTCNCYKIDSTTLMGIVNNFINDSSIINISIVNDSTIRVCYGNGSCVNIGIVTNITNLSNVYLIGGDSLVVCSTDTTSGSTVCDTLNIGIGSNGYIFQNGISQVGNSRVVELGGLNSSAWLQHDTYLHSFYYRMYFDGQTVFNYPYTFRQYQYQQVGTGVASFQGLGGTNLTNNLVNNNVKLGINSFYGILNDSIPITGYMGDRKGYSINVNGTGEGAFGLRVDDPKSKITGVFLHTRDNDYTDAVTIFGADSINTGTYFPLDLTSKRIAVFKTDKSIQLNGYGNGNFQVSDTGRYKPMVVDSTDGTLKVAESWFGSGGGSVNVGRGLIKGADDTIQFSSFPRSNISINGESSFIPQWVWTLKTSDSHLRYTDGKAYFYINDTLFAIGGYAGDLIPITTDSIFYSTNFGTTWSAYWVKWPYQFANITSIKAKYPGGWNYIIGNTDWTSGNTQTVIRFKDLQHLYTMTTTAEFGIRIGCGSTVDQYGNIYIFGGGTEKGEAFCLRDIWMSTAQSGGANWVKVQDGLTWLGGDVYNSVQERNGYIYVINAGTTFGIGDHTYSNLVRKIAVENIRDSSKWKTIQSTPSNIDSCIFGASAVYKGNIVFGLGYSRANTNQLAYLDNDDQWHYMQNYSGGDSVTSNFNLGITHASDFVVIGESLYGGMGNAQPNFWQLHDSTIVEAHTIKRLAIRKDFYISQTPAFFTGMIGNNLTGGTPDASNDYIKRLSTDPAAYIAMPKTGDFWIGELNDLNSSANTDVVSTTGRRLHLLDDGTFKYYTNAAQTNYIRFTTNGALDINHNVSPTLRFYGNGNPIWSIEAGSGSLMGYNWNILGYSFGFLSNGQLQLHQYGSGFNGGSVNDSVLVVTSTGLIKKRNASAFGGISGITADNGLTANTSTNVQLGGTLLTNTTINSGVYTLNINGTSGTSLGGYNDTGTGLGGATASGIGLAGSGIGGGLPLYLYLSNASNSAVSTMATIQRSTSGSAAAGLGGSLNYDIQTSTGSARTMNQLISKLTDATDATRTSQFIITGVNSSTTSDLAYFNGDGYVKLPGNGSPIYTLEAVTAANYAVYGHATGAGVGVLGVSFANGGIGLYGQSNTGASSIGVKAESSAGIGIQALSTSGLPASFSATPSSTNTVVEVLRLVRASSSTPAAGIGGSIDFQELTSNGSSYATANRIISTLTTATTASETSQFKITGMLGGSTVDVFTANGDGSWQIRPITATEASAITPANGMIVCVSSTDATFTSIGFWGYSNGAWAKF